MSQVLGVKIDNLSESGALTRVSKFLIDHDQKKIFTPNPEMLVLAQKDADFKAVLNSGDLNLCDGFGIRFTNYFKIIRLTGVDFVPKICELAEMTNKSIFLLGTGSREILDGAERYLLKKFPNLKIVGSSVGPKIKIKSDFNLEVDDSENQLLINYINEKKPDIIFVAFGQVKQEKWINKYLAKIPSVKVAMGIGGTLDYFSGRASRAPLFFRKIGLEWIWRLVRQPWRAKRVFNATVKFLILCLTEQIRGRH